MGLLVFLLKLCHRIFSLWCAGRNSGFRGVGGRTLPLTTLFFPLIWVICYHRNE